MARYLFTVKPAREIERGDRVLVERNMDTKHVVVTDVEDVGEHVTKITYERYAGAPVSEVCGRNELIVVSR